MKNIFSRMVAVLLTMWLGFAAGTANAIPTISSFGGTAAGGYTALFGNTDVGSSFDDWINFSVPGDAASSGGGVAISNFSTSGFNVLFSVFDLYEISPSVALPPITGSPIGSGGPGPISFFAYSGAAAPGNYWLHLVGSKVTSSLSGGYSGTITTDPVAAVPEPETYAMLLIGLGLLGFAARRRKNNI